MSVTKEEDLPDSAEAIAAKKAFAERRKQREKLVESLGAHLSVRREICSIDRRSETRGPVQHGDLHAAVFSSEVHLGEELACAFEHKAPVTTVCACDGMVFSGSEDSAICMMDFSRRIPVLRAVCEGHEQGITSIVGVPSAGEQYFEVMSSSWDGTVRKWRIPRSTSLAAGSSMVGEGMQVARWSHTASVLALDYEGEHLFTACEDGHCYRRHRYALGTQGHKEFITRYGQRGIQCNAVKAAHLSDGRLQLWVGSLDGSIVQYDADSAEASWRVQHDAVVRSLCFDTAGVLFAAFTDDLVRGWQVEHDEPPQVLELQGHYGGVTCMALDSENGLLWTGSIDRTLRAWELATATEVCHCRAHSDFISAIAVDGKDVYSGSKDTSVRRWTVSGFKVPHTPCCRINTLDGRWKWPQNQSNNAGMHLYLYPPDFAPGSAGGGA